MEENNKKKGFFAKLKESLNKTGGCCGGSGCCEPTDSTDKKAEPPKGTTGTRPKQ